jgi:hypothetical protein
MPNRLLVLSLLLLLSALLLAAAGAQGASAEATASPSAFEEDFESLEDELEEEGESEEEAAEAECEMARGEADEGEMGPDEVDAICAETAEAGKRKRNVGRKKAGSDPVAPEECLLRSAHAHAAVDTAGDKLKLTIGYTAYEPVAARVEVRRGSSRIATMHRRLGRSGVLRIVKDLGPAGTPKRVVVSLAVPASPGYCDRYETEKVPVR